MNKVYVLVAVNLFFVPDITQDIKYKQFREIIFYKIISV